MLKNIFTPERKYCPFFIVIAFIFIGCDTTPKRTVVFLDKQFTMGQSLSDFKKTHPKNLESPGNEAMPAYTFYVQHDTLFDSVKCRLFYAFYKDHLMFLQAYADTVNSNIVAQHFDTLGFAVTEKTNLATYYKKHPDNYFEFVRVKNILPAVKGVHFICIDGAHLRQFGIDSNFTSTSP